MHLDRLVDGHMAVRHPLEQNIAGLHIQLDEASGLDEAVILRASKVAQVDVLGFVGAGQGGFAAVHDIEFVHVERGQLVGDGDGVFFLEVVIQDIANSLVGPIVVEGMLQDEGYVEVIIDIVDSFKVEDVAIVEHAGAGPDENLPF